LFVSNPTLPIFSTKLQIVTAKLYVVGMWLVAAVAEFITSKP